MDTTCPVCGKFAKLYKSHGEDMIKCSHCGFHTPYYKPFNKF